MKKIKSVYIDIYLKIFVVLLLTFIGSISIIAAQPFYRQPIKAADDIYKENQIESKLTRGVSTKADVLLLFGEPGGSGTSLIPTDTKISDLWYYEDIKFGQISLNMDQKILLIYFKDDIYDGYMWWTNKVDAAIENIEY